MAGSNGNKTSANQHTHQPQDTKRTTPDWQTTLHYHEYYEKPTDTCPQGRLPHDSDLREALTRKKLLKLQHLTRKTWIEDYPHLAHYLPTDEECEFTRYRTKRDVQAARAIDRNTAITNTNQTPREKPNVPQPTSQQTTPKQTQKTQKERERKAAYDRIRWQNLPKEGKLKRALYQRKRREEATAHETPEEEAARKKKEAKRVRLYRQNRTRDTRSEGRETGQTLAPRTSTGRKRCSA